MANWCDNELVFKGDAETLLQVYDLFRVMIEAEAGSGPGQLPDFLNEPDGMFFNVSLDGDVLEYETRWFPNGDAVRGIADHFGLGFIHRYWENGCQIYGLEIYRDGALTSVPVMSPFLLEDKEMREQEEDLARICADAFCK